MTVIPAPAQHQHSAPGSAVPTAVPNSRQMKESLSPPLGDASGVNVTCDPPLDSPFLQPVGAISRPSSLTARTSYPIQTAADKTAGLLNHNHLTGTTQKSSSSPRGFSLQAGSSFGSNGGSNGSNGGSSGSSSRRSLDISAQASLASAAGALSSTAKQVSWLDCGFDGNAALKGSLSGLHGILTSAQPTGNGLAGNIPAGFSNSTNNSSSNSSALASVHSAPVGWGTAGDLRDQGRISSAGAPGLGAPGNRTWLGAGFDMVDEAGTPMQAMTTDCLNNLLGGLSSSIFCDSLASTPLSRTAAASAATAAGAANKHAPVLPDFIEAWQGSTGGAIGAVQGGTIRRPSSTGGSAFTSANGAASAAAAAATGMQAPTTDADFDLSPFQASFGEFLGPDHAAAFSTHPLGQPFSGPVGQIPAIGSNAFSNGSVSATWGYGATITRSHQDLAAAAAAAAGSAAGYASAQAFAERQSFTRLQRTSSAGGPMSAHLAAAAAATAALAPTYSNPYHGGLSSYAAGALYGYPNPMMMSAALQGMASCPVGPGGYSNPALAAMLAAYTHNSFAATSTAAAAAAANPAGIYEAMALAQLNNAFNSSMNLEHQSSPLADSSNGSWGSQPGGHFPANETHGPQWRNGRKFGGPGNSKVDPKSMCGVDPRLCVGSPADVEFEVCRRNPGLAELLALQPRSVKLGNVAVRQDTLPPEMLASKRPDGPITPDELTIESGLLRHCFGLPSSIGPDLVRAARHAVTRGDELGSGLEPFFWVLQHKLKWLLKRPVFFKGQLLRGEIHAITDQQRVQSFAQVTEQRSKLGELLLVLFSMLKEASASPSV